MYKISFVVDGNPALYYQAELLLLSLDHFSEHPKNSILIQCTNRVDESFLSFLRKHHYEYRVFEPFLDGIYCNKIKQLEAFYEDENCEGVFLLDTDMFALGPLLPSNPDQFSAKIVDATNPPLEILNSIFAEAGLVHDHIKRTDLDAEAHTYSCNFNGGYYYIPEKYVKTISQGWEKWARWLFDRPHLFGSVKHSVHTDQVAMAMAISEADIEFSNVASNYNCPTHYPDAQNYFDADKPVYLLHYHNEINVFGLLNDALASNKAVKEAIEKANNAIATHPEYTFYKCFRKSLNQPVQHTAETTQPFSELSKLIEANGNKLQLILHAGTPKTGSTSLQFFLQKNQKALKDSGYLYPEVFIDTYAPKHQWLVNVFMTENENSLTDYFRKIMEQVRKDTHTIILSTEGMYNHWHDFSPKSKGFFREFSKLFALECWIWFREPVSFAHSLYRQHLKNPQVHKENYGRDLSLDEMIRIPWFRGHLDYLGFIYEWESIVGRHSLKIFLHKDDILTTVKKKLNLNYTLELAEWENSSLSDIAIELLRIINRPHLTVQDKITCVDFLKGMDEILSTYPYPKADDTETQNAIKQFCAIQQSLLRKEYHLDFTT